MFINKYSLFTTQKDMQEQKGVMDSINFRQDLVSEDEGLKRGECCQAIDYVVPLNQTDTLIQATL